MALTKFKLVDTTTKAVFFQGDTIPVDKIDDALAEKLIGKTHVLERLQLPVVQAELPALEEASVSTKRKS